MIPEARLDLTVSAKMHSRTETLSSWATNCENSLTYLDFVKYSSACLDAEASNNFKKYFSQTKLSNSVEL